jgi:hypothetical protein
MIEDEGGVGVCWGLYACNSGGAEVLYSVQTFFYPNQSFLLIKKASAIFYNKLYTVTGIIAETYKICRYQKNIKSNSAVRSNWGIPSAGALCPGQ